MAGRSVADRSASVTVTTPKGRSGSCGTGGARSAPKGSGPGSGSPGGADRGNGRKGAAPEASVGDAVPSGKHQDGSLRPSPRRAPGECAGGRAGGRLEGRRQRVNFARRSSTGGCREPQRRGGERQRRATGAGCRERGSRLRRGVLLVLAVGFGFFARHSLALAGRRRWLRSGRGRASAGVA